MSPTAQSTARGVGRHRQYPSIPSASVVRLLLLLLLLLLMMVMSAFVGLLLLLLLLLLLMLMVLLLLLSTFVLPLMLPPPSPLARRRGVLEGVHVARFSSWRFREPEVVSWAALADSIVEVS